MTKDNILEEKKIVNKIDLHAELIETGVEQVLIPGDPERATVEQRSAGGIDIDDNSWEDIMNSARDAGLSQSDLDPLLS